MNVTATINKQKSTRMEVINKKMNVKLIFNLVKP